MCIRARNSHLNNIMYVCGAHAVTLCLNIDINVFRIERISSVYKCTLATVINVKIAITQL